MSKRIQIRMSKDLFKGIEKYSVENNFHDPQDAIREILREKIEGDKSFFSKLKRLFFK